MIQTDIIETLKVHVKSKYPYVALVSSEEKRVQEMFTGTEDKPGIGAQIKRKVMIASTTRGIYDPAPDKTPEPQGLADPVFLLSSVETEINKTTVTPTVYLFLDFHEYINLEGAQGAPIKRKIRDMYDRLKAKRCTIVFVSPSFDVPTDLQKVITVFDIPLPNKKELEDILCTRIHALKEQERVLNEKIREAKTQDEKKKLEAEKRQLQPIVSHLIDQSTKNKDRIVQSLMGLTSSEADLVVSKCAILNDLSIRTILSEKKQIVRKAGAEYIESNENESSIGGLKNLKAWILSAKNRFTDDARKYGITPPRGILMVGAPGTGKSLTAKVIGNLFGLPVIKLDMAGMTSKWYGETGNRMRAFLKLAKALSPCIVFVDEIDKMIGTGQGSEHEESARTRGALLTAMEEDEGIFWLATCNNPGALAPELMARFPVVFHVDLPTVNERREIFTIHLAKVGRDPAEYDLNRLVTATEGYVGREIRNAIQEALGFSFDERTPEKPEPKLTEDHIIRAVKTIKPTSVQRKEEIDAIRAWSIKNAQNANETEEKPTDAPATEDLIDKDLEVTSLD